MTATTIKAKRSPHVDGEVSITVCIETTIAAADLKGVGTYKKTLAETRSRLVDQATNPSFERHLNLALKSVQ